MTTTTKSSNAMHIALWVAQALLALTFIWAAYTKLIQPIEETAKMLPWAKDNPGLLVFTGFVELIGALGIILPSALRIQPNLSIMAAYGIIALMISAAVFHISRGEGSLIGMNIFFLLLAVLVAWGRSKKAPIIPKS
ncbi:MAG: DoxX family protein [Cytophagaceae bacterium]|jgi:hypothetical protein|nr:DoxX family protein [Cytophagaceae bacterium]